MRRFIIAAALIGLSSGSALAQANPNAPQPNSSGTGVYQPGTTNNGTAVDRPTTGSAAGTRAISSERGDSANSMRGPNAASPNTTNGATSGAGAGAGSSGR
jgi:hypothetical protein